MHHIRNQTHFVEFVNNSAQFHNRQLYYDECQIRTVHFHKRTFGCVCMCKGACALARSLCPISGHQLPGFANGHAVLVQMKIFYTKYHANYFITNGAIETTEQMVGYLCAGWLLNKLFVVAITVGNHTVIRTNVNHNKQYK